MADKKTRVVLEAETRGFEKAKRDVKGVNDALGVKDSAKNFKQLDYQIGQLFRQMRGLTEGLKQFNQQLRTTGRESDAFKGMAASVRDAVSGIRSLTQARERDTAQAKRDADERERLQKRRGFAMGVMQGAGVGEYFPEGGLSRNVAGRAVGSAGRRAGHVGWGATGGAAFSGAAGFAQGLAGIPLVGGVASGQFQALQSAAQEALAFEDVRYQMMQYRGFGVDAAAKGAGRRAAAQAPQEDVLAAVAAAEASARGGVGVVGQASTSYQGRLDAMVRHRMAQEGFGEERPAMADGGVAWQQRSNEIEYELNKKLIQKEGGSRKDFERIVLEAGNAANTRNQKAQASAAAAAERRVREAPTDMMRSAGVRYGMAAPQALQFGGEILGAAGMTSDEMTEKQFKLAAGAQGRLGIGPDVMGAFMRGAGPFGGDTSGKKAEDLFTMAVNEGITLGLKGSDLQEYMHTAAQALQDFNRTGMPIDLKSVNEMARGFSGLGVGGVTGERMAQGIRQTGMQIGAGGPQNAAQFLVMRQLFGYKGGGTKDFFEAQSRAARGEVVSGGLEAMMGSLTKGKDQYANAMQVQQFFKQIGVQLGPDQAMALAGGDAGARQQAEAQLAEAATRGFTASSLTEEGAAPGAKQRQAGLENRRLAAGARALPGMQSFEDAQTAMLRNASEFSGVVKVLADNATKISELLGPGSSDLAKILEALVAKVF